jgi:hypothetical protein
VSRVVQGSSDLAVDVLKLVSFLALGGRRGHYAAEGAFAAAVVSWAWWPRRLNVRDIDAGVNGGQLKQ